MKEILLAIILTLREAITKWIPLFKSTDFGLLGKISEAISVFAAIAGLIEYLRKKGF